MCHKMDMSLAYLEIDKVEVEREKWKEMKSEK